MAQRGRPPVIPGAKQPEGPVIRQETNQEKEQARGWKKEPPKITYDVLKVLADGKTKIKVYRIESRKGITDRRLVAQFNNGKQVVTAMSRDQLIKAGVDPDKLK